MSVDTGLLINLADTFIITDITGVLAQQEARMRSIDLAVGLLFFLGLFQSLACDSVRTAEFSADHFSKRFNRRLMICRL